MAYRRGMADRSRAKRLRRKSKERRDIRGALTDLEFAKQHEARRREKNKTIFGSLGGLAGLFLASNPAGLAAWIAGGRGVGDYAYHQSKGKTEIKQAQEALEALESESMFRETREEAEAGALAAEVANEQYTSGDIETGLMGLGTDWVEWYTLLSGLDKPYTKKDETEKRQFISDLLAKFGK